MLRYFLLHKRNWLVPKQMSKMLLNRNKFRVSQLDWLASLQLRWGSNFTQTRLQGCCLQHSFFYLTLTLSRLLHHSPLESLQWFGTKPCSCKRMYVNVSVGTLLHIWECWHFAIILTLVLPSSRRSLPIPCMYIVSGHWLMTRYTRPTCSSAQKCWHPNILWATDVAYNCA